MVRRSFFFRSIESLVASYDKLVAWAHFKPGYQIGGEHDPALFIKLCRGHGLFTYLIFYSAANDISEELAAMIINPAQLSACGDPF